jgi:hypothetical protein
MKTLFGSDKDVKLLQQRNILTNYDSTEKEVARLFKKWGGEFERILL